MSERIGDSVSRPPGDPGPGGRGLGGPALGRELGSRGAGSRELAAQIVGLLGARHQTVAVAESLTGGLLGAAITAIPGASVVFRGGIIAYATELKAALLGVPAELLARYGPVHPDVAAAMATGARDRLGATVGVATTGVAGPDPADGKPPGTVHIAVTTGQEPITRALALDGGRDEVRRGTVEQALRLLWSVIWEEGP